MKTQKPLTKRICNKLLAVRKNTLGKRGGCQGYDAPQLANDIVFNLALAAEKGQLTPEQYNHFNSATRLGLVCEFLAEARDALEQNRTTYKVNTSWGRNSKDLDLDLNVYKLTRAQLSEKHKVDDWHLSHRVNNKVYTPDVLYGIFLREHGLTNQKGIQLTEADLPSLESVFKSDQPDALKRYSVLQRARL